MSTYIDIEEVRRAMAGRWAEAYRLYTPLIQKGEHLCGPCPLHKGEGPNFKVEAETGLWFCHSQCGRGGDFFQFVMGMHGLSLPEAVDRIARWAGMVVPPRPAEKPYRPAFAAPTEKTPAQEAARWVSDRCAAEAHATLLEDAELLAWLRVRRGLTVETLQRFEVGVIAPELHEKHQGQFWPRITFPVRDRAGHLTNIRKHLFAFRPDAEMNRAKWGKTLPWASGLPADLFPLSAVWGEETSPRPSPSERRGSREDQARPDQHQARPDDTGASPLLPNPLLSEGESRRLRRGEVPPAPHILLVEGEADALLANQIGFPAVTGTLGAGGWRPQNTRDLAGVARVTILYDADEPGRKGARQRAKDLAGTVPDIRIATLPPGLGKDLSEWMLEGGGTADALRAVIDGAEPASPGGKPPPVAILSRGASPQDVPTPPLLSEGEGAGGVRSAPRPLHARTVDLADVPAPPADLPFLWGPYLNEGASHWLTGKTGLGKSTFAFNLACALAEGRTLWGIECRARRLLYVDLESGDIGRALKVQRLYGDRPRQSGRLLFVREPLRLPDESAELCAYADAEKFDLVIFDTARRVFAVKDENDNAEVYNRIIPTLDALKARGVATLTMGHPPKNGGLGARGAGAQEDAGDVNLLLTMHRGEVTDADGVISLSITKNRLLGLGQPPLYLKRIGRDQFERVDAAQLPPAAEDTPEKQSPRDRCRQAVLTLLESNGGKPVAYKDVKNALEAQGHAAMTLNRALKDLMDAGEVEQPSSGRYALADPFA